MCARCAPPGWITPACARVQLLQDDKELSRLQRQLRRSVGAEPSPTHTPCTVPRSQPVERKGEDGSCLLEPSRVAFTPVLLEARASRHAGEDGSCLLEPSRVAFTPVLLEARASRHAYLPPAGLGRDIPKFPGLLDEDDSPVDDAGPRLGCSRDRLEEGDAVVCTGGWLGRVVRAVRAEDGREAGSGGGGEEHSEGVARGAVAVDLLQVARTQHGARTCARTCARIFTPRAGRRVACLRILQNMKST